MHRLYEHRGHTEVKAVIRSEIEKMVEDSIREVKCRAPKGISRFTDHHSTVVCRASHIQAITVSGVTFHNHKFHMGSADVTSTETNPRTNHPPRGNIARLRNPTSCSSGLRRVVETPAIEAVCSACKQIYLTTVDASTRVSRAERRVSAPIIKGVAQMVSNMRPPFHGKWRPLVP
jgi:hypothetical protein